MACLASTFWPSVGGSSALETAPGAGSVAMAGAPGVELCEAGSVSAAKKVRLNYLTESLYHAHAAYKTVHVVDSYRNRYRTVYDVSVTDHISLSHSYYINVS